MTDATFIETTSRPDAAWGAVMAMALCVALLIASEFMPVSLLTPMAEGLSATEGQTGQAISISGLFAVAASMLITTVAGRLNRKTVLVALTGLMLASLVMVAVAQSFAMLMLARALLGICVGGFWALATAVIMRLVPASEVPRGLSLMYGGQAIAAAFAAPMGSYLGDIIGWRGVFWALVPLVAGNLVWHLVALPSLPARGRQSLGTLIEVLRRPYFARGLIAAMLSWGAAFTMFTYLRPYLETVTRVDVTTLSILLLVLGSAGFIGTWAAGRFVGNNVAAQLKLPALIMGAVTLALIFAGASPVLTGLLLAIWGVMNTAMSVIFMTWMSQNVDDAPEAAGSLMVAAIQLSILLGAVIGGLLLDGFSITATFAGSVLLSAIATALIGSGRRMLKP
ncbi:MFS transporter [Paracoccus fistulariae]|uniref:MFS transporter n=1 Tax=Paracoccus fistulariae TaxID=658446 RepID=A0ABY7SHE3_9RHOB|nr:MFS transporter [Paracoccus fistulariae]MDB6181769.1 MFS transporter [Paracoccus fistulariae]WCR05937.1 MFS transporter [Paracoccus fistulariae]